MLQTTLREQCQITIKININVLPGKEDKIWYIFHHLESQRDGHCLFSRYMAPNKMQGHIYAFSRSTIGFVFHGSFKNYSFQRIWLAVEGFPPIIKWLKKQPKLKLSVEKTEVPSETA